MESHIHPWKGFRRGLLTGILSTIGLITCIYVLNMLGLVAVSVSSLPDIQEFLGWAYDNLRLSIIPFSLVLILYFRVLYKLKTLLKDPESTPERIAQTDNWVNISISVFFGIGVIWTAIGMRSALIVGLGDLDSTSAAQLGSFEILRRLIEGGILLALSTTIFGAVGGYFMRLNKILVVGARLQQYYAQKARALADNFEGRLKNIESYLAQLADHKGRNQTDEKNSDP